MLGSGVLLPSDVKHTNKQKTCLVLVYGWLYTDILPGYVMLWLFRKHVEYYGGFSGAHSVIRWLWDIVENDFDKREKGLFLKVRFAVLSE